MELVWELTIRTFLSSLKRQMSRQDRQDRQDRQTDKDGGTDRGTNRRTDVGTDGRREGGTDRQADRQTDRQTDRLTDRQTDRQKEGCTEVITTPGSLGLTKLCTFLWDILFKKLSCSQQCQMKALQLTDAGIILWMHPANELHWTLLMIGWCWFR